LKKTVFVYLILGIFIFPVLAQSKTELGGGIGAFNYTGDLSRAYKITSMRPAFTGFYKYNINNAISFRASLTAGYIFGTDSKPIDPFASVRARSFKVFAVEVATLFEYDFIDMKGNTQLVYGSPYLFGGFGIFNLLNPPPASQAYSPLQPVLPLGFGVKYVITPNWYLALEFGARFTFFDYLDGVSYGDPRTKDYQYGSWYDNDMYYFLGLTATYSFFKIQCPTNPYK